VPPAARSGVLPSKERGGVVPGGLGNSSRPYGGARAALICVGDDNSCEGKRRCILELEWGSSGGAFIGENYGAPHKNSSIDPISNSCHISKIFGWIRRRGKNLSRL
jgi:hypothetical protein